MRIELENKILNLIEYYLDNSLPKVCIHLIILELMSILEENGNIKFDPKLYDYVCGAENEKVLKILRGINNVRLDKNLGQ